MGCCLWGRTESDMTEVTQQQQRQLWWEDWNDPCLVAHTWDSACTVNVQ